MGDFLNGSIDDGSDDEDRASKQFNIVPVKPKQTRNNSNDQQSETDSRSLDDFNNFLKKVETALLTNPETCILLSSKLRFELSKYFAR